MCLYTAEQQNSVIDVDLNYVESYKALEEIKEFEKLDISGGASLQKKATKTHKLPALGVSNPSIVIRLLLVIQMQRLRPRSCRRKTPISE